MNYLQQILNFEKLQELNQVSPGQARLWYVLMYINNLAGWKTWFTVANSTLEFRSRLSRSGINKARNELKQLGYIDFKSNGRKATSYRIIPLMQYSTQDSVQGSVQTSKQGSTQDSVQGSVQTSSTLYKQNKTKQNSSCGSTHTREEVFNFWQKDCNWGFPSGIVLADLNDWINEFGPDLVIYAMKIAGRKQVTAGRADGFLSSVFNVWRQQHIKTLEDAKKANDSHEQNAYNSRQQRNNYGRKPITEKVPSWFGHEDDYEKPRGTVGESGDPMP